MLTSTREHEEGGRGILPCVQWREVGVRRELLLRVEYDILRIQDEVLRKTRIFNGQLEAVGDIVQEIFPTEEAEFYARERLKRSNIDEFVEQRRAEEEQLREKQEKQEKKPNSFPIFVPVILSGWSSAMPNGPCPLVDSLLSPSELMEEALRDAQDVHLREMKFVLRLFDFEIFKNSPGT